MSDIKITRVPIGWDQTRKGWRYDFNVEDSGRHFAVPFLISDDCPEEDRSHYANECFREWVAKVAAEAAKL